MLAALVRKSMTREQVDEILRSDSARLESLGLIGTTFDAHWRYYTRGLTVSFISDDAGVLRVSSVTFWPLSD